MKHIKIKLRRLEDQLLRVEVPLENRIQVISDMNEEEVGDLVAALEEKYGSTNQIVFVQMGVDIWRGTRGP